MPIPLPSSLVPQGIQASPEPFPAWSKSAVGLINNVRTEVTSMQFSDKIMVTISQDGRLAHWIHVPLQSSDPNLADRQYSSVDNNDDDDAQLLPMAHLTATTILGGRARDADTIGELYATQIASAITVKNPEEKRLLVLGVGMVKVETDGQSFMEVLELVLRCV